MKARNAAVLVCRIVPGAVFLFAAIGKINNPAAFADAVDNYRILPYIFVTLLAIVLPWMEAISGVLLLLGKRLAGSSLIVIALNLVFIAAIASAIIRGLDIDCGCFSVGAAKAGYARLLEDLVLLAMAVFVFREAIRGKGAFAENQDER